MFSFGKPVVSALSSNFFYKLDKVNKHVQTVLDAVRARGSDNLEVFLDEMFGFATCIGTDLYQSTATLASSSVGAIIFRAMLFVIV